MEYFYTYTENNQLKIIRMIPKDQLERKYGPLTDEQHEIITLQHLPDKSIVTKFPIDQLPIDRTYRNAWEVIDGIATNLAKKAQLDEQKQALDLREQALEALIQTKMQAMKAEKP